MDFRCPASFLSALRSAALHGTRCFFGLLGISSSLLLVCGTCALYIRVPRIAGGVSSRLSDNCPEPSLRTVHATRSYSGECLKPLQDFSVRNLCGARAASATRA